jgi:hypothetical protein
VAGALTQVRDVMRRHLPLGFEEGVLYGMIAWFVPPERHGTSYNGQPLLIAALASQKHYMALCQSEAFAATQPLTLQATSPALPATVRPWRATTGPAWSRRGAGSAG